METSLRANPDPAVSGPVRRLSLVLNEKAGALLGAGQIPDLAARLESGGATTRLVPPGDLPDRLRAAMADSDAVVVAGGDGTAACAAAALAGTGLPLGLLPAGTMNLLAKDLRLPIDDLDAASDVILAGAVRTIDIGRVDEHVFLCACMLGAPATMGRHREQARSAGPWRQWLQIGRAAVHVFARPRRLRLSMVVDGVTHRLRTPSLTITLNPMEDVHGRYFARARLDAGVLVAYAVHRNGLFNLARVFIRLAMGRPKDPALTVLSGTSITLHGEGRALRVLVDGEERLLASPATFSVQPRALRIFAPAAPAA